MDIKFTILGCGSSFGVPRIDGFFGGVGYKKGKPIEEDIIEATKRMVLIELDFTKS